jgi:[ribosomal protein S18]-alanine N-acetyltransferase
MTPDQMAALHAACFTTPPPWSADAFSALLADPLVSCLTEPQALLLVRVVAGEAEILTLAVHPDRRRQGVAQRLVAAFHRQVAQDADAAFLEVAADNAAARALYDGMGYRLVGNRRGYYRSANAAPVDALVLRRDLSGPTAPDI